MRFSSPTFCALIGLMLGFAPLVRAADPQPYKADHFSTGQSAMDATLRATSDLVTLRTTAPVGPYGLIARARGDIDRLKTVLESYGYYDSKVTIKIDGLALNDPRLQDELAALPKKHDAHVQISFELGPLYHLRKITIEGGLPPSAQTKFTLKTGDPAVASNVLAAGARVLAALEDEGYAFARVDPPVAYEDQTEPVLDVTFHVETGPKLNVGHIYIEGLKRAHESLVRRRLLLHTGELYRASAVEHARADLLSPALGVFAAINVEVGKAVDDTGGVPITFRVRERLRHTFGVSAAYSTDLGGSGGINWGDRDMFGNAEQFNVTTSVTGLGGSSTNGLGYDVPIKYILPDFGHRDQSLQFGVEAVKQDLIAYDQRALKLGVTLTRQINKLWTVSAGVTATEENINQVVGIETTCKVTVATQSNCLASDVESSAKMQTYNYTLPGLPLTVTYDSTNLASPLDDPTHGMRDSVSIVPTFSLGHSNAIFLITTIKAATYFDLDHLLPTDPGRSVLAARALIGAAEGASVDSLPPDQRFYGGGSASIRGYPYQGVGPYFPILSAKGSVIGATTYPVGATTISAASLEYRQRFGQSWGAAFFVDGGQVGNNLSLYPSNLFVGVGAGARYYTPIGPIRLDIAVPLKRYDSDPQAFQVYIGLGQAF
ncbi:MAG: autotransporter assembly complex family protein [Steroidobacterales bacterium]